MQVSALGGEILAFVSPMQISLHSLRRGAAVPVWGKHAELSEMDAHRSAQKTT